MKKIFKWLGVVLLALIVVVLVRTWMFGVGQGDVVETISIELDEAGIVRRMSESIRFETVSTGDPSSQQTQPFVDFSNWMAQSYPEVHRALRLTKVAEHTLLYKWQGSDPSIKPILLTAHYDVVPVVPGTEADWQHPPFAGVVADGFVWGRGTLDDKSGVIVMMEAVTKLLSEGFAPTRTIYLSFGHDEEVGGRSGAANVAELLIAQGVQLEWTLDEGSFVTQGLFPGFDKPLAMLNVAEKGSVTFDLIASGPSGHSSMPADELPIDILAQALVNVRKSPLPGGLAGVSAEMIDGVAKNGPFALRMLVANKWLFGGMIESQLSQTATSNAFLRTTTAPTLLRAGVKTNVIAPTAQATINFRLHPRDTPASVQAHLEKAIDDDRVEVRLHGEGLSSPASVVSSSQSAGYAAIEKVTKQVFAGAVVVPGITIAGTDTKHYSKAADDSYRLQLMVLTAEDAAGFHGTNERVSVENLLKGTTAYYLLMKQSAG